MAKKLVAPKYTKYLHHGSVVTVQTELKGKHREHCLCYACEQWYGCTIRKKLFNLCVQFDVVAPLWECPTFTQKIGDK